MHKRKHMPSLHNAIIYNPSYIDYYLLQTLLEFKNKFNTIKPYPHVSSIIKNPSKDELIWVRLEAENALSEVFLRQRDESRLVLKQRLTTMMLLIGFETLIFTHGFLFALYSVLPTAGILETASNIIAKHKGYKNELYAASIVILEKALAIVKSPDRYTAPEIFQKQIKSYIHEAEKHVALKRAEMKEVLSEKNPRSWFSFIADNFMYRVSRILAMGGIFGIQIPTQAEVSEWQKSTKKIAPLAALSSWPTDALEPEKPTSSKSDEGVSNLEKMNKRIILELESINKRLNALESKTQEMTEATLTD